jgi:hypothetical protein
MTTRLSATEICEVTDALMDDIEHQYDNVIKLSEEELDEAIPRILNTGNP